MTTLAFDGAAPVRALGAAVDFIGTPGAAKKAAGRVTVAAAGAVDLTGAAAAPGRASGAALVVADLVAELVAEVAGALGAAAGGVADVTVAVIEYDCAANRESARTSKLRFMDTPFIVAAATIRGMRCRVRRFRR